MSTNTYGIIPMNPWNELDNILGNIWVLSFMAVGENSVNTPILQISSNKMKGMNLKIIDGMLEIYFWSIFGPHE